MKEINVPFGKVQILESNNKFGSSILVIGPGKEIARHFHKKMKEIEVILEGEILCGDKPQGPGDVNVWETGQAHGYRNESGSPAKILCITMPPYDPQDEFEAD
ncbi:MAG: cupin domain-containing protein [archaeon]|nr:MAG: cupin domain-containing protein [archaeon]